jgi:hypothetical protein
VANRNKGRRGRQRKRRPVPASAAQKAEAPSITREQRGRSRPGDAGRRSGRGLTGTLALGERPQAPWHPLPLSELLILVGSIGTVFGVKRGESGIVLIAAGLAAVLIGTVEVTLREHLSGYRAHTLILSLLPTIALYTGVVILARPPLVANLALLLFAVLLATVLFKLLRARFLDARRERAFSGR